MKKTDKEFESIERTRMEIERGRSERLYKSIVINNYHSIIRGMMNRNINDDVIDRTARKLQELYSLNMKS